MELLKYLNIPLIEPQRVFVKDIVTQLNATGNDKKIIESHIHTLKLVALLNEQTIRIRSFKDDNYSFFAIYVFFIELKTNTNITEFSTLIHSAFPESTLLLMKYNNQYYISSASKRINKLDSTKTVLEDMVISNLKLDCINYLNLNELPSLNLMEYNNQILKLVYKLKVYSITNVFPQSDIDYKKCIKQYESLVSDIKKLRQEYNQAKMMAEKARIDDVLFDKEEELRELIRKIKK